MATATKDKPAAPAAPAPPAAATATTTNGRPSTKGQPRPRAAVDEIDFSDSASSDDLKAGPANRVTKWGQLLDKLYEATAAEDSQVPRNEDGSLKFIRLGTFANPGGARTQIKSFEDKGLQSTYDFKSVVRGKESSLWVRVKEVE